MHKEFTMNTDPSNQRKAAEQATTVVDPQMLSVLKLAIGAHPMAVERRSRYGPSSRSYFRGDL